MKHSILALLMAVTLPIAAQQYIDTVRAMVGDTVVTDYDLRQATKAAIEALPSTLTPEERQAEIQKLQDNALDLAIDQELIYLDFQDLKGKVPMDQIQEQINHIVTEQAGGSEERFREMLHRENITYKEFQERIRKRLAVDWLRADRSRNGISITDEQILMYLVEHRHDFDTPVSYHVQIIQLRNDGKYAGKIDETFALIRQRLRNGEAFAKLAELYSEGPTTDLGWRTSLAPALQKVIGLLKPGEIYWENLPLGDSTYLVRLAGRKGGPVTNLTPELAEQIEDILFAKAAEANYKKYIESLYMKYPVQRF
ncbi:MAG: SurA N-terminal domain-containing protein [Victivallales bacterium]|nr:SurA N-terminal domain-containing protein [Victivallales bacterium]